MTTEIQQKRHEWIVEWVREAALAIGGISPMVPIWTDDLTVVPKEIAVPAISLDLPEMRAGIQTILAETKAVAYAFVAEIIAHKIGVEGAPTTLQELESAPGAHEAIVVHTCHRGNVQSSVIPIIWDGVNPMKLGETYTPPSMVALCDAMTDGLLPANALN